MAKNNPTKSPQSLILLMVILLVTPILALSVDIPTPSIIPNGTSSNDSYYLRGLSPQQVANLFVELDPNYFSNPNAYLNTTTGGGMNYTNLALINQSNDFGNNNLTTTGYGFFGWLGSLTSRITKGWFNEINTINATITNLNVTNITMQTPQFVSIGNANCYPLKCLSWCVNGSGTNTHTYYNGTGC